MNRIMYRLLSKCLVHSCVVTIVLIGVLPAPTSPQTSPEARAAHVLSRMAFGPRPGEVGHVTEMGVDRWIDAQLWPERIPDEVARLTACPLWAVPVEAALQLPEAASFQNFRLVRRDSAAKLTGTQAARRHAYTKLLACRLAWVERTERQLLEVLVDFWQNHFSLHESAFRTPGEIVQWDRDVLRSRALGSFRVLLGEAVRHPALLTYLDNHRSAADVDQPTLAEYLYRATNRGSARAPGGSNENFGRELLELYTLGVGGGYTQADVIAVARAFTGWTHSGWRSQCVPDTPIANSQGRSMFRLCEVASSPVRRFVFDSTMHDAGVKTVLGRRLGPGRGLEDGEEVLDILANHPATATFITRKLAIRLVSDRPPEELVQRAANVFLQTHGDIRSVVRALVTSPEFNDPAAYATKVRTPLELALAVRRALAAAPDTSGELVDILIDLEQPPYGHTAPNGWPETADGWMNAGAMMRRLDFAGRIGSNQYASLRLDARHPFVALARAPFVEQVDSVIAALLPGRHTEQLREGLRASKPDNTRPDDQSGEEVIQRLLALVFASAEYQRR